jgi:hypothetical protein
MVLTDLVTESTDVYKASGSTDGDALVLLVANWPGDI